MLIKFDFSSKNRHSCCEVRIRNRQFENRDLAHAQTFCTRVVITISNYQLEVVHEFTYLGSTITDNLSLDAELNKRIGKAATTLGRLATRVWENPKLTTKTKVVVYNACVVSTLLYGSEAWTTYSKQEQKLNSFHLGSLRRILRISWRDKVPNTEVLDRAGLSHHVHTTQAAQNALDWPCAPHGGWQKT